MTVTRIALLMSMLCASLASAQEEEEAHADIFVGRPPSAALNQQTLVGGAIIAETPTESSDLNLTDRVFEGDLGTGEILGNNFYTTEEPGFFNAGPDSPGLLGATNPVGAEPLLAGETPVVTQIAPLTYWDGTGPVDFGATPAELFIQPFTSSAGADGSIDSHPIFDIDDLATNDLPAGGIYLATLTVQLGTLAPSDAVSVLFVTSEDFEGAVEIAEDFLNGVPEPASMAMVFAASFAVSPLRRRVA